MSSEIRGDETRYGFWVQRLWEQVLDWVYPPRCGLCARLGDSAICPACRASFRNAGEVRIKAEGAELLDARAIWAFDGRAAQAVRRLKYERVTSLAGLMAEELAVEAGKWGLQEGDWVVPVPISGRRRRERGFNQSELLCERFPEGFVRSDLMKRIRHTRPQASLKAEARLTNLEGAFWASPEVKGRRVLLVDDVVTTGGTATACARTLLEAGAMGVRLLAFCGEAEAGSAATPSP